MPRVADANLSKRNKGGPTLPLTKLTACDIVPDLEHLAFPVDRLTPLPGNPRKGDVEAVARSYATFGQRKPIVARREGGGGIVIAGNHQLAAAQQLGWAHIAVGGLTTMTSPPRRLRSRITTRRTSGPMTTPTFWRCSRRCTTRTRSSSPLPPTTSRRWLS